MSYEYGIGRCLKLGNGGVLMRSGVNVVCMFWELSMDNENVRYLVWRGWC